MLSLGNSSQQLSLQLLCSGCYCPANIPRLNYEAISSQPPFHNSTDCPGYNFLARNIEETSLFYCCVSIRFQGNVLTEPLPRNGRCFFALSRGPCIATVVRHIMESLSERNTHVKCLIHIRLTFSTHQNQGFQKNTCIMSPDLFLCWCITNCENRGNLIIYYITFRTMNFHYFLPYSFQTIHCIE